MQSSIKIDFRDNGKGLQPVIAVKLIDSDDSRDKLLKTFFQSLGGLSSWLAVSFDHHIITDVQSARTFISIQPVVPEELAETAVMIKKRLNAKSNTDVVANTNPLKDRYFQEQKDDEEAKLWDEAISFVADKKIVVDSETLHHLKSQFSISKK